MASLVAVRIGCDRIAPVSLLLAACIALAAFWIGLSAPAQAQPDLGPIIAELTDPAQSDALSLQSGPELRQFYRYRQFSPAWVAGKQVSEAIRILRQSGTDGLDPAAFRVDAILADRKEGSESKAAEFDVLLTDAMLTYIREMSGSRVDPTHLSNFIALPSPAVPAPEILEGSLAADSLQSLPDKLAPPHPEYALLKKGLARYLEANNGSPHVAQIIANMERWRWLSRPFGDFYVEVNSADATLKLVKDNEIIFSTRLVTGKPSTPTPLFETTINGITVNPFWDIPGDIAAREILPKEERHPGYLDSHQIVADRPEGGLRQLPGTDNPLGQFLMEMPNSFDAYLHDTPSKALFEKPDRHFSHGCMRVENMESLVSFLLTGGGAGSDGDLASTLDNEETQTLPLPRPIPVYVLYWTAEPAANGAFAFHRDVYGWDSALLAALGTH